MLKTTVAGIPLESCIYNASGPRTGSIEALTKIAESKAGAVLSKSATLKKQDGNPLPRFVNKVLDGVVVLLAHEGFELAGDAAEAGGALSPVAGADLHRARAAQDQLERIAAGLYAAYTDDIDILAAACRQQCRERAHVRQGSVLDESAAQTAEPVLRRDRFALIVRVDK